MYIDVVIQQTWKRMELQNIFDSCAQMSTMINIKCGKKSRVIILNEYTSKGFFDVSAKSTWYWLAVMDLCQTK